MFIMWTTASLNSTEDCTGKRFLTDVMILHMETCVQMERQMCTFQQGDASYADR